MKILEKVIHFLLKWNLILHKYKNITEGCKVELRCPIWIQCIWIHTSVFRPQTGEEFAEISGVFQLVKTISPESRSIKFSTAEMYVLGSKYTQNTT